MSRLRILLFTHAIARHADDHPQFINELALAWQRAGHEVEILTASHHSIDRQRLDPRLRVTLYRYAPKRLERLGYGESLREDRRLDRAAPLLAPLLFLAGTAALRRKIGSMRPDLIHVHWALPNGPMAALATIGTGVPYILSFPGSDVTVIRAHPLLTAIGRWCSARACALTTNSHDLRDAVAACGVPAARFHFVLYGSDEEIVPRDDDCIARICTRFGIDRSTTLVLAVGRMVPKKGFRYLIEALPRIDRLLGRTAPCTLLLVGEGPLREELQRLAERLGVRERVIFAGKVAYRQLPQWYWLADILAMPAVREPADGLNVVVVEAMKYALPVAATDVGGNELVVRDGENGRLCPERDPDGLARCLAELIEDPERRTRMGAAGRRIFRQIASWDRIVEQYERLFRTAARRR